MLIEKKVVLVTGCNRGIGKSIAEIFLEQGAILYANARKENSLKFLEDKYNRKNIFPLYFDVTDTKSIKNAIMKIKREQGHLDVLVNNAAVMTNQRLGFITDDLMLYLFKTNVFSVINFMQYSSKIMREGSSIINISSIVGERGNEGQLLYSATKGAVISLTKSAAKELGRKGIRVNPIAPGLTNTDALNSTNREYLSDRIAKIPMGRIAEPSDIANACLFLASDLSKYISGEILGVNGSAVM